jgi:hypothetical protein
LAQTLCNSESSDKTYILKPEISLNIIITKEETTKAFQNISNPTWFILTGTRERKKKRHAAIKSSN